MSAARSHDVHTAFDAAHASVPAACFAAIIVLSMLCVQPVLVAISLAGALAFSVLARGVSKTLGGLRWQLPMLALVCLLNPVFSASGSTMLFKLGPRVIYLESLAYGATMGALMVAVIVWFEDAACVLTQDRLLALAGGRAQTVTLVISMASALVPQLVRRGGEVQDALAACTAAGEKPGAAESAQRTSSLLLTWSLEDSLERADSMRARGWESGVRRTSYRPERLAARDAAALVAMALLAALCGVCGWAACSQWTFYPAMPELVAWWGYVPFAVLAFVPTIAELAERALWRRLS